MTFVVGVFRRGSAGPGRLSITAQTAVHASPLGMFEV
jgi:hypothetical protein